MNEPRSYQELIAVMNQAEIVLYGAYVEMHDSQRYLEHFATWEDFLDSQGKSFSWWKQIRASHKMIRQAQNLGYEIGNEAAARKLRTVAHRAVNEKILPRVLMKAQKLAEIEESDLLGRHINAVVATWCVVLDSGGYAWVNEQDEMMAFDAACLETSTEMIHKRNQHARDGAKASGWSKPFYTPPHSGLAVILRQHVPLPLSSDMDEDNFQIEIKWRTVKSEVAHEAD
jgi:hypothetical protein